MEKIFDCIRQFVLKYRKRLIYGVLTFFIGQICFFGVKGIGVENCVFAADGQTQNQVAENKFEEWKDSLSFINKAVYVLIYPMMILAGKLVDNSLVYGEVFGFDAVLWKLWNIVKNLANFTLGFIFLFKICKYLIDGKEKVKDILLKALIAGIGIQASWFIMAALIDVSTILTYGVGGLPITMLKDSDNFIEENKTKYNPYILKNLVSVEANNLDEFNIYLTSIGGSGDFFISECRTFVYTLSGRKEELILAPKMIYYKSGDNEFKSTDTKRCHYYGQVYYFSKLYEGITNSQESGKLGLTQEKFSCDRSCTGNQSEYTSLLNNVQGTLIETGADVIKPLISDAVILEVGDAHMTGGVFGSVFTGIALYPEGEKKGLDVDNKRTGEGEKTSKLQDILNGDSYVGVFTALYSSLMERGRNVIPSAKESGLFVDVLNTALSVGFLLAIGIPLIIVAVIFMMRIGILRVAISLSPFIVLFTAFDLFKSKRVGKVKFLEYFEVDNLIPIIFSPAIICFAISLSAVLIAIIQNMNVDLGKIAGETTILGGLVKVSVAGLPMNVAEFINLVLGVAMTWFIVWAAIETSKLGESKFIQSIKDLSTSALGAMKVVPVPTKNGVEMMGVSTVFGGNGQKGIISRINDEITTEYNKENNEAMRSLLHPDEVREEAQKKADENKIKRYADGLSDLNVTGDWRGQSITIKDIDGKSKKITFNYSLPAEQEKLIDAINSLDDEKRAKFGKVSSVQIGGDTWEFNTSEKRYVKQTNSTPANQNSSSPS